LKKAIGKRQKAQVEERRKKEEGREDRRRFRSASGGAGRWSAEIGGDISLFF
jgi:hypothetical protein